LTLSRSPTDAERKQCSDHWIAMQRIESIAKYESTKPPIHIRRDAVEENTGEKFSFDETLKSNEDFVSDLQPNEVDHKTLALADLCLVLFNCNEFVYVY
jgi:hypothetical protein